MSFTEQRRHERVTVDIYVYWGWTEDCPLRDRIINLGVEFKGVARDETANLAALVAHYSKQ
jgi:hypothetical protein